MATNSDCSVKFNRLLLEYGVIIVNRYSEQDGTYLFTTEVRADDCHA